METETEQKILVRFGTQMAEVYPDYVKVGQFAYSFKDVQAVYLAMVKARTNQEACV